MLNMEHPDELGQVFFLKQRPFIQIKIEVTFSLFCFICPIPNGLNLNF